MVRLVEIVFQRSKNTWDDALVRHAFVKRISYLIPTIIVYLSADLLLPEQIFLAELVKRFGMAFFIVAVVAAAIAYGTACPAYADGGVADEGLWPKDWPEELYCQSWSVSDLSPGWASTSQKT